MKKLLFMAWALVCVVMLHAQSKVYMTKEISPESLVRIYKSLGVPAHGHVAVKISTGEMGGHNYLKSRRCSGSSARRRSRPSHDP